jgi:hypothetical protein
MIQDGGILRGVSFEIVMQDNHMGQGPHASRLSAPGFGIEAAEMELAFQVVVNIPNKSWRKFEAWARKPVRSVPALADLAGMRPAWRD